MGTLLLAHVGHGFHLHADGLVVLAALCVAVARLVRVHRARQQ